jgi:hypothetical protein
MNRWMQRAASVAVVGSLCLWPGLLGCGKVVESSFSPTGQNQELDGGGLGTDDSSLGSEGSIVIGPPFIPDNDATIVITLSEGGSGVGPTVDGAYVTPNTLTFNPPSATIVIDGTGSMSTSFTLLADFGNGPVQVTPQAVEFDRPDLAVVTGTEPVVATAPPTATPTPYAGTGKVHAVYGGKEAIATLTVQVHLSQYAMGSGLTATSPSVMALNGASLPADATAKSILYPYDGTVWPLGLVSPLVMWTAPQMTDVYRLHYAEANYTVDFYTTLAALPAQVRLDQATWDRLTNSNEAAHGTKDPVTFSLSRYDGATAYASATETWSVAPESLRGSIYYWSASRGATGGRISQFRPGPGPNGMPNVPQVLTTTGACAGCHAVSADGSTLVADIEDPAFPSTAPYIDPFTKSRAWVSFDITQATTPQLYKSNEFGADPALTPDGKYLVFGGPRAVAGAKYLSLGDPRTGTVIAASGLDSVTLDTGETNLEMPAFSPDGKMLALVEAAYPGTYPKDRGASDNVLSSATGLPSAIAYLNFTESVPSFNPTLHKITDSSNPAFATAPGLAYPSFTPQADAVAFHAGTTPTGCNATGCDDNALDDGNLFIATLALGGPIRLAAACDPPDMSDRNSSIEPTFNPAVRGGYSWAVFTSMRKWGNQPWPATQAAMLNCATGTCNAKRRLWLAAVDTTIGAADPSHPAIYLEGQDFTTPNMRAFYTLEKCIPSPGMTAPAGSPPVGTMCTAGFECCSGFCEGGMCVEPNQLTCVGLGGACTSSGQCCNTPLVQCLSGICAIPQAR